MRTYLRSFPFFCAFDTLSIVTRLLVYRLNGITPLYAVQAIVASRFDGIADGLQGLQNLES
jgi:hypothetical protein